MRNGQLRIAMLCAHSCPMGKLGAKDTGGMSVYVLELARELGKYGHLVDVYTRVHDPRDKQTYDIGRNARLIHLKAGGDGEIGKLAVYSHLPDFTRQLEDFRKRHQLQYDLIYGHYWLSGWVGSELQKGWNVPHLIMFHTLGAVKNAVGIGEAEPELRLETEKYLARSCQRIIVATAKEKKDIISYHGAAPENISVIPCGVNLSLFRPINKKSARQKLGLNGHRSLLFVGRIEPLKGIDKLLMALTYLKHHLGLRLFIIGGDANSQPEIERLRELAQDLKIQDAVAFLGRVKQEELPLFYSAADVCVVPSYYESFGLVILESLACGTPVVSTRVGGAEGVIRQGETGYVVTDNAPSRLAEKIDQVLSRNGTGTESAKLMRASVTRFGWSEIARALIAECEKVCASYSSQKLGSAS